MISSFFMLTIMWFMGIVRVRRLVETRGITSSRLPSGVGKSCGWRNPEFQKGLRALILADALPSEVNFSLKVTFRNTRMDGSSVNHYIPLLKTDNAKRKLVLKIFSLKEIKRDEIIIFPCQWVSFHLCHKWSCSFFLCMSDHGVFWNNPLTEQH